MTFTTKLTIATSAHEEVIDITADVQRVVRESKVADGICVVYVSHATAAIAINENADPNIGVDLNVALDRMIPAHAGWKHDRIDDNAAAHIKSAIVGPSETIPIAGGRLCLGTWQNVFLCEFDGPRAARTVVVTVIG
jgi:secondary thiamine-phosphate synthase enzyme